MKKALIILESDVLTKPLYFGKSGDLTLIYYFLQHFEVYITSVDKVLAGNLKVAQIPHAQYQQTYQKCLKHECVNILNSLSPASGAEHLQNSV